MRRFIHSYCLCSGASAAIVSMLGRLGRGHALKAGNNLLNLICRMASFEVVSLLVNAGVDAGRAVDILQKSSGRNYATEITLPDNILSGKMHQGFSMALMKKDAWIGAWHGGGDGSGYAAWRIGF
jgi:3-hydroxyisobutyrate dehydrogenase